jgi:glycine cleavage system transcriptional repressor
MEKVIISVVGQDQPGIVAAISNALFDLECNIENISQTILQSIFGAILIVAAPDDISDEALASSLETAVSHLSLEISAKRFPVEPAQVKIEDEGAPFVITTIGPDKKGLVAAITKIIADYGINITNLQAVFKGGEDPMGNLMIYEVSIPNAVALSALYHDLESKASELDLEINIQHRRIFEAMNRI